MKSKLWNNVKTQLGKQMAELTLMRESPLVRPWKRDFPPWSPFAKPALGRLPLCGHAAVYKSLCAWCCTVACSMIQAGLVENKDLAIKEEFLVLRYGLHSLPAPHYQQLLCWGGGGRQLEEYRLLRHAFRLPHPLHPSSLLVNPMIKALTFNETWERWMP